MMYQITQIEFDFDDEEYVWDTGEQQQLVDEYVGQIFTADDEDDLIEEVTCASGWCIKSIDYVHVLS